MLGLALSLLLAAADYPCLHDAERLCKGVDPGGGRVTQCMRQHDAELSPACQERRKKLHADVQKLAKSCEDDVDDFCGGVIPGHGAVLRCLRGHQPSLSEPCRKDLEAAQQKIEATRDRYRKIGIACENDRQRFCTGVDVGGGAMLHCLEKHHAELGVDCKEALAR
jgi:Cysteine rich repeat